MAMALAALSAINYQMAFYQSDSIYCSGNCTLLMAEQQNEQSIFDNQSSTSSQQTAAQNQIQYLGMLEAQFKNRMATDTTIVETDTQEVQGLQQEAQQAAKTEGNVFASG